MTRKKIRNCSVGEENIPANCVVTAGHINGPPEVDGEFKSVTLSVALCFSLVTFSGMGV
jgi:hypothetical protein